VKAAWVKQGIDPFTRQHLAFFMLSLDCARRTCVSGFVFASLEVGETKRVCSVGHIMKLVEPSSG
jgi:hypothetical protein